MTTLYNDIDRLRLKFGYGRFKMPYSKSNKENNIKPRIVRCLTCDYVIATDLAAPYCGMCNGKLITLIINGKLASGNR
jgi:hypothetical protein